jgi:hypothetical protein
LAWIKFDKDLVNDPRIIRAAGGLAETYTLSVERAKGDRFAVGSDLSQKEAADLMRNAVIGALVTLWVYADTHIRNGDVLPISMGEINQMVGIQGFCEMLGPDWVQQENYGTFTVLPGYCEKNGLVSREKRRADNAERQRRYREKHNAESNDVSNAVSNADVTPPRPRPRPKEHTGVEGTPSGAFLRFWGIWPKSSRKQSRGGCWERWRREDLDQIADQIIAHVEALKLSMDWRKEGGKFIPAPLVYLNQKRWEGADLNTEPEKRMVM